MNRVIGCVTVYSITVSRYLQRRWTVLDLRRLLPTARGSEPVLDRQSV